MIKCKKCKAKITKTMRSYTIVENRVTVFPGVVDSVYEYFCGRCWKEINIDTRVKELLEGQEVVK